MRVGVLRKTAYLLRMTVRIPPLFILLTALWPWAALAQDQAFAPVPAAEVTQADLLYQRRPIIVFADSAEDPTYLRQMDMLLRYYDDLAERDVILITDTDPAAPSELRQSLRPRGFSLVIMDKDWKSAIRKPLPWDGREIIRSIDKMPLARSEALERYPAGR